MKDYSILLRGGGVTVEISPEGELCLLENGTEGFGRVDGVVTLAEYAVSLALAFSIIPIVEIIKKIQRSRA